VQVSTRQSSDATVVVVDGNIDLYNSPEVRRTLLGELQAKGAKRVLINLQKVKYIDSSGVASLVEGLKASRAAGVRLSLVGLSPAAREVLELSRLAKLFEVYESEEQAFAP
jgi:anti-sigma B factor antagonist